MSEEKTVQEVLAEMVDKTVPGIMETIMADEDLATEEKAKVLSLADVVQYHLRLMQAVLP